MHPHAVIIGEAAPGATIRVQSTTNPHLVAMAHANRQGEFRVALHLPQGLTTFDVTAQNLAGAKASTTLSVTSGNVVVAWNAVALNAVRTAGTNPPMVARNLAMIELAVYDAVDAIHPTHALYGSITVAPPPGASATVAAAGAAYTVLSSLYPAQVATFNAALQQSLAAVPARTRSLSFGEQIGAAIVALRANDGTNLKVAYTPTGAPGNYVPTPPDYLAPVGTQFPHVTPFALTSPNQFLPPPPPALNSPEYAAAYNETKTLGAVNSTVRTPDETAFAKFWSDLAGTTFTPAGHWNQVAEVAATQTHMSLETSARMFAMLNVALADAGIACWSAKNNYNEWRPVTAIRVNNDGLNPATTGDPTWTPLWNTPNFQSYPSGHSAFSGAAATVLDAFFGSNFAFTDTGDPTLHLPARSYTSFDQAANEAGFSRIVGGIHFAFDNTAGLAQGRQVATYVLSHILQ
jgi:membrane-associated phospholipid phosphatase